MGMWLLCLGSAWRNEENWCFWTVVLEKTRQSPLDCKELKPVNPKGNQPWIFIEKTDAEAEAPILLPPDVKIWLTGKEPDAWKDWKQEKGTTEDEMVGWHHQRTWVWASSGSWWWTVKPGVLQSMGSQSDMTVTQLTELKGKKGFPRWHKWLKKKKKKPACQCRRHKRCGFDPWVRKILWRRAWKPTPVFFPGESHGQRSLVKYSPLGHKVSDTTEAT